MWLTTIIINYFDSYNFLKAEYTEQILVEANNQLEVINLVKRSNSDIFKKMLNEDSERYKGISKQTITFLQFTEVQDTKENLLEEIENLKSEECPIFFRTLFKDDLSD